MEAVVLLELKDTIVSLVCTHVCVFVLIPELARVVTHANAPAIVIASQSTLFFKTIVVVSVVTAVVVCAFQYLLK